MIDHWIAGKLTPSGSGRWGGVWNPATGKALTSVAFADEAEVVRLRRDKLRAGVVHGAVGVSKTGRERCDKQEGGEQVGSSHLSFFCSTGKKERKQTQTIVENEWKG